MLRLPVESDAPLPLMDGSTVPDIERVRTVLATETGLSGRRRLDRRAEIDSGLGQQLASTVAVVSVPCGPPGMTSLNSTLPDTLPPSIVRASRDSLDAW